MKRILVVVFFGVLTAMMGTAQTIDEIQQQLNQHIAKRPDIAARSDVQDKKADDIKFVYDAWTKQTASYKTQLADYDIKNADVEHKMAVVKPSLDNWNQRLATHNANKCTEHCTANGACDGSCAWYENERIQLEQNKAALQQEMAPIIAEADEVDAAKAHLDIIAGQLDTIGEGLSKDIPTWKQAEADLKVEWDANEAEISRLQKLLATLKGEKDSCFAKIPPACQVNPLLDDKCEQMHAACGKLFDGNK